MIDIEDLNLLIDRIPEILSYVVYGYIFLVAYYWISFKDNKDFKNVIIKSVAASYILTTIFDIIILKLAIEFSSNHTKNFVYIIFSAALGLILGKIITHPRVNNILCKLHIYRTTNENIWDDVIKPYTWVRVFMSDGTSYMGLYKYGEPFKSEPIIVLIMWQKLDKDANVIIDNTQNPNELIMLNTKDFEKIEFTHVTSK